MLRIFPMDFLFFMNKSLRAQLSTSLPCSITLQPESFHNLNKPPQYFSTQLCSHKKFVEIMKKVFCLRFFDATKSDYFATIKVALVQRHPVMKHLKKAIRSDKISRSMISDWCRCNYLRNLVFNVFVAILRWPRSLMATRNGSSVLRLASTSSVRAGGSDKSKWFEKVKANNHLNSVPSLESETRTTICNSWIWTMGNSIVLPRLSSSPTPINENTSCWA